MSEPATPLVPCREAVRQMWDYLDGTAVDAELVDAHLAYCRRCCGELEFVTHLRGLLASQAAEDAPSTVTSRLERFIEELR